MIIDYKYKTFDSKRYACIKTIYIISKGLVNHVLGHPYIESTTVITDNDEDYIIVCYQQLMSAAKQHKGASDYLFFESHFQQNSKYGQKAGLR